MTPTPEQQEIGKENFQRAVAANPNRREFLAGAAAATAVGAGGLGAMYWGYGAKLEEPLRVGIIGTGDEGGVLIGALNPDYIDVVAIADIRPYNQHRAFHGDQNSAGTLDARPGLITKYGWENEKQARDHVKFYTGDYMELIDDPDVEAVIIALPLWLHHPAAIKAMRAGKHVLTEKLMAHNVAQCKEMGRVADETGLVLATGHQRHYSILYDNAVDQIKRGLLGDIHHIRAQWHRSKDSWTPPLPPPADYSFEEFDKAYREAERAQKNGDIKPKLSLVDKYPLYAKLRSWSGRAKSMKGPEKDVWEARVAMVEQQIRDHEVDAKKWGYEDRPRNNGSGDVRPAIEELIRWRLWDRTGGGLMAELGSHQLDAASIFLTAQREDGKKAMPLSVTGAGHRSLLPPNRDVDDHVYCTFEFPANGYFKDYESREVADPEKKVVVTYSSIVGNGFGGYGEVVMGTHGTLILEREQDVMLYQDANLDARITLKTAKDGPAVDTYETGGGPPAAVAEAAIQDVSRGYKEEIEHWAWCIRNPSPENQPKCKPAVALADAVIALTSNIAMAEQRRIEFDPKWFDIDDDDTPDDSQPRQAKDVAVS